VKVTQIIIINFACLECMSSNDEKYW
jgi:hypothetical protein